MRAGLLTWRVLVLLLACVTSRRCSGCECACTACEVAPARSHQRDAAVDVAYFDAAGQDDPCDNGLDDDQDGTVDEHCVCMPGDQRPCYGGPPALARVGTCALGRITCVEVRGIGTWDECLDWEPPTADWCLPTGLDEDCDGSVDETCRPASGAMQGCFEGTAAERGVGACRDGTQAARDLELDQGGVTTVWDDCMDAVGPTEERCNAVDDDCDGTIDEGHAEDCDLDDDDCDGRVDELPGCGEGGLYWTRWWPGPRAAVLPAYASLYRRASDLPLPSGGCAADTVPLETSAGVVGCVAPPTEACTGGAIREWLGDPWSCVPCDYLVALPTGERRCAPAPSFDCAETAFVARNDQWSCGGCPTAPSYVNGRVFCVVP